MRLTGTGRVRTARGKAGSSWMCAQREPGWALRGRLRREGVGIVTVRGIDEQTLYRTVIRANFFRAALIEHPAHLVRGVWAVPPDPERGMRIRDVSP